MVEAPDAESLANEFWTVSRRLRSASKATLDPFDLTPSQTRALGTVMRHGDMRLGGLSEHLGIAARSTTEVVDALEHRGYVERVADPDDRRATLVHATESGRTVMSAIRSARHAESAQLFDRLNAADRVELARLLRALTD